MTLKLAVGIPAYRGQIAAAHSVMWAQLGAAVARTQGRAPLDRAASPSGDAQTQGRAPLDRAASPSGDAQTQGRAPLDRAASPSGDAQTQGRAPLDRAASPSGDAQIDDDVQIVMFGHVDTCGIDRARNALVRQAMVARAEWLLMVDSDTFAIAGKDVLRMILERPKDAAAVGAPVIRRGEKTPNVWQWNGERHVVCGEILDGAVCRPGYGPYAEVDAIGAAILAIDVHVIERLGAKFEWVNGMSEDLAMCRKLRVAGEKIYVDPRVATVHLGQPEILTYTPEA